MTYKQLKEYIVTIYGPNFRKVHLVLLFPPLSLKGFETLQHHHFRFTRIHRYYSSSQFSESSFSSFIPPLSLKGFETLRHHHFRFTRIHRYYSSSQFSESSFSSFIPPLSLKGFETLRHHRFRSTNIS